MHKLKELFNGLLALLVACIIVGVVLAVILFGGLFMTIAGGLVGLFVIVVLVAVGIKEWLDEPESM